MWFSILHISQSSFGGTTYIVSFFHSFLQLILFQPKVVREVWLKFLSLCPGSHFPCRREIASPLVLPSPLPFGITSYISSSEPLSMRDTLPLFPGPRPCLLCSIIWVASVSICNCQVVKSQVQILTSDHKGPLSFFRPNYCLWSAQRHLPPIICNISCTCAFVYGSSPPPHGE